MAEKIQRLARPRGTLKAPLPGSKIIPGMAPAGYIAFVFAEEIPGGCLKICQGNYKKEFVKSDQPFVLTRQEFETHLRQTGKFREVT